MLSGWTGTLVARLVKLLQPLLFLSLLFLCLLSLSFLLLLIGLHRLGRAPLLLAGLSGLSTGERNLREGQRQSEREQNGTGCNSGQNGHLREIVGESLSQGLITATG